MAKQTSGKPSKLSRRIGYPKLVTVQRGCTIIGQTRPEVVYVTVEAQLHNLGKQKTTALLQVFKIATLAAQWMIRDINEHKPVMLFARHRKRNSTSYYSDGIAATLRSTYRKKICSRYTLNANIFGGLCTSLAATYASTLQKIAEAEKRGWNHRYQECAAFVVEFGKHRGKKLKDLPRDGIFGYAFLQPKIEQCERAFSYLNAVLQDLPEEEALIDEASTYRMEFGPYRGKQLGTMRPETLRRLQALVQRNLDCMEQIERVRQIAQDFLRFTPPGLPTIRSGVVSDHQRTELEPDYLEALNAYTALPLSTDEEQASLYLTENERNLFQQLQRRAYEATNQPKYMPLRWNRADGVVRGREVALLYEQATGKYLFLAYILDADSRFRSPLRVKGDLIDVNNPTLKLKRRERPNIAKLYELEFSRHQREILDLARRQADSWKNEGQYSGAMRVATLHAYHNKQHDRWWFEVHLAIGLKPSHYNQPQHVVGIHIDPFQGIFASVVSLDGLLHEQFHLDELRIAQLLDNHSPELQAQIAPQERTAKERSHRLADALVAICKHYHAQLGFENISYRSTSRGLNQLKPQFTNSRTVFEYLKYKLPLATMPPPIDIKGIAPRRDCGRCGARHDTPAVNDSIFICSQCGHHMDRNFNTAQEVARRTLWVLAAKKPPQPKKPKQKPQTEGVNGAIGDII